MTFSVASETAAATGARAGRREWVGLAVLTLPAMLLSMDLTVLYLAVPALSADLAPSGAQLLWITDIYGFLIAGSLITMGTLGDRIGRRRLLLIGAAGFAMASVLAAFSTSAEMLIATRALLGVTGATLMPSTLSLIRTMFHAPNERTFAIGVWATSFSVGGVVGPLVGGALLQYFWWGAVFLLGVPVMALLLVLGPLLLPEYRDPAPGRFDLASAGLSLVSVLAVIYGVKRLASGDAVALPALAMAAGLALGVIFVRRQRRLSYPLLDLELFRTPVISVSLAVNVFLLIAWAGNFLFVAQYLQLVLGMGALEAGLWTIPGMLASMVGCLLAPVLVRRRPAARIVLAGIVVSMVGFSLTLALKAFPGVWIVVAASSLMFAGIAAALTLTTDMIVSAAPPQRAGSASALSETGAELGLALGVAVLGSLGAAIYRGHVAPAIPAVADAETRHAILDTLAGATAAAVQLGAEGGPMLAAARAAFVHGMVTVAMVSTAIALALAALVALVLRPQTRRG